MYTYNRYNVLLCLNLCVIPYTVQGQTPQLWQNLHALSQHYFSKGLAKSTAKAYASGTARYVRFCNLCKIAPLPLSESKLSAFVSLLAKDGLSFSSIRCYLSAVRHHQIASGYGDPGVPLMSHLEYVLQGIRREKASQTPRPADSRQPMSPAILKKLHIAWSSSCRDLHEAKMLWAAACLSFFGFLRVGEFTCPGTRTFDDKIHLSPRDISVDNAQSPSLMCVRLKQSKTDQLREGVTLVLGATDKLLCPVASMMGYLVSRGLGIGPLFIYKDGTFLTRDRFVDEVQRALKAVGVDSSRFNGHSFRIGAATTAAARGLEDSVIKTLGRWESSAYLRYIRTPRSDLANYAKVLAAS